MPWMPEVFTGPIADARREQEAASTNDAIPYYEGILADEPDAPADAPIKGADAPPVWTSPPGTRSGWPPIRSGS